VPDQEAEVVVGPTGLLAQLGAGRGCDVVRLGEGHFLLLLWWGRDKVGAGGLGGDGLKGGL